MAKSASLQSRVTRPHNAVSWKDYYEMTKNITDLANVHCKGKMISFLEGGYDLVALEESIKEHLRGLR